MANQNEKIKNEEKDNNILDIRIFISAAIVIFLIVLGSYIGNFANKPITNDIGDWGTFGDYMGGTLNPIFAFLSFIALLYTIQIQSKELKASREELELTRDELARSADAQKEQSDSIKIQNFENTFFNMISLHNEIINNIIIDREYDFYYPNKQYNKVSISYKKRKDILTKRKAIDEISSMFTHFIIVNNPFRKLPIVYNLCHEVFQDILGHYFGNIYQILKFISTENIENKRKYSDLFRAQFSSDELQLLFYHCTGSIGSIKFKKYIEEFEFFEHLTISDNDAFKFIFNTEIYNNKAFGDNQKIITYILSENEKFERNIKSLEKKTNNNPLAILQLCKYYFYKKEYDLAINMIVNILIPKIKNELKKIEEESIHYYKENNLKDRKLDLQKTNLLLSDIYFEMGDKKRGEEILNKI